MIKCEESYNVFKEAGPREMNGRGCLPAMEGCQSMCPMIREATLSVSDVETSLGYYYRLLTCSCSVRVDKKVE